MRVLLYPQIYENSGTGNLLRMFYLYSYLRQIEEITQISMSINNKTIAEKVLLSIGINIKFETLWTSEKYDVIIHDYLEIDLKLLKKLRSCTKCLVALDFSEYEKKGFDIIINLYSHNQKQINKFQGRLYEGLQFAILKQEVIDSKQNYFDYNAKDKVKILITFGGEDPNSNTLNILEAFNYKTVCVKVLLGVLNKDKNEITQKYSDKVEILDPTPYLGKLIVESDLVICGGGTTLIESIYLGNPIIAIPQNNYELDFINFIKQFIPLFSKSDLPTLLHRCQDIEFRKVIHRKYTNYVDGKGKERIKEIILGGVTDEKSLGYRCW